jgi:hypothetical protein
VEWLAGKRTWFEAKSDSVLISGSAGDGTCQAVSYKWLKIASTLSRSCLLIWRTGRIDVWLRDKYCKYAVKV